MSISYAETGAGMCHTAVSNAFAKLVFKGILTKTPKGQSFEYGIELCNVTSQLGCKDPLNVVEGLDVKPLNLVETKKERSIKKERKADAPICSKEQSEPRSNSQPPNPTPAPPPFPPPLAQAWNEWEKHIRESGRKMSASTKLKQVEMLSGLDSAQAVRLIEKSILNGWTGLFADKKPSPICSRPFIGF